MNQKSFILFTSWYEPLKKLTTEDKGMLFDAVFQYHLTGIVPELSPIAAMAFSFMRSGFEQNSMKYEAITERNRSNGMKGGRPKKNPENPVGILETQRNPKNLKYDNDSDSDNDSDNVNDKWNISKIVDFYHKTCPALPQIRKLTEHRIRLVKTISKDYSKENLAEVFRKAQLSNFLTGSNDRAWIADFDWLLKSANFLKVLEGNYDNREKNETVTTYKPNDKKSKYT